MIVVAKTMRNQLVVTFFAGVVFAGAVHAQDAELLRSKLHPKEGDISLLASVATLHLPPGFRYLDKEGARVVLTEAWGNPPDVVSSNANAGLIVPADFDIPLREAGWLR